VVGRFPCIDPLAEKYYSWSGYNYVMDSPLLLVDPDGRYNIIYVVNLDKGFDAERMIKLANEFLGPGYLDLKTELRLFTCDPSEFSTEDLDAEDGVLVLGKPEEVKSYIAEHLSSIADPSDWSNWTGKSDNPERAEPFDGGPDGIRNVAALSALGITGWAKNTKTTVRGIAALAALHASGHNAGLDHSAPGFMTRGSLLNAFFLKGNNLKPLYGELAPDLRADISSVQKLFEKFHQGKENKGSNEKIKKAFEERYGKGEPIQKQ